MVLGEPSSMDDYYDKRLATEEKIKEEISAYYRNVFEDFEELKRVYPFCYLTILPTVEPREASIRVVAADKGLIDITGATEDDFLGEYSRELWIGIPLSYKKMDAIFLEESGLKKKIYHRVSNIFTIEILIKDIGFALEFPIPLKR